MDDPDAIRLLILDANPAIFDVLPQLLVELPNVENVGFASSEQEALSLYCEIRPHIVLTHLRMLDDNDRVIIALRAAFPHACILAMSLPSKQQTLICSDTGLEDTYLKTMPIAQIVQEIRALRAGTFPPFSH